MCGSRTLQGLSGNSDTLTQALIDRLISKVYLFPGDRIEIEYVTQDVFGVKETEESD